MKFSLFLRFLPKFMLSVLVAAVLIVAPVNMTSISAEDPPPPLPPPMPPHNIYPEYLELELAQGQLYEGFIKVNYVPTVPASNPVHIVWHFEPPIPPPDVPMYIIMPQLVPVVPEGPVKFPENIYIWSEAAPGTYEFDIAFEIYEDVHIGLGKQHLKVTVVRPQEPPPPCPEEPGTRTLGFYKNHPCVVKQVVSPDNPIKIGGIVIENARQAMKVLKKRSSHESRLISQLLTTILNCRVFGIGNCSLVELGPTGTQTVRDVIFQAKYVLSQKIDDKDELSAVQDLLDKINNSNTEAPLPQWITDKCSPTEGED